MATHTVVWTVGVTPPELVRRLGLPVHRGRLVVDEHLQLRDGVWAAGDTAAARDPVDPVLASRTVWFDAFVTNVDRTARNPNLLCWHRALYLIDHGAALYFHHDWGRAAGVVHRPYRSEDHVLKPFATATDTAGAALTARLTPALLDEVIALVPEDWLDDGDRTAYRDHLAARAADPQAWLP